MTGPVRSIVMALMMAAGLIGSFSAGVVADRLWLQPVATSVSEAISSLNADVPPRGRGDLDTFNEVWKMVQDQYYFQPVDKQKVLQAGLKSMVGALGDEHSHFLTPEENQATKSQMQGHFDGIGVWISTDDGQLRIIAPMDGSPAQRVGVLPDDVIVAIDGRDITSIKPDEALPLVRGRAGTKVTITVRRRGNEQPLIFEMERARIEVDAVTSKILDGNIGYIRATVFGDKTTAQLDAALKEMSARNVRGIVLDLRNNGGGWVTSAREMLGRFLPDGAALVEKSRNGERIDTVLTSSDVKVYSIPLVVLVNGGSASASEIVAGALKDRQRATIIGERTFGKGSIQQVRDFGDGSSARLTTALWLTPNKQTIEKSGIIPDVYVGTEGEPVDDTLVPWLVRSRQPRAIGPTNPDGLLGPPDRQLERARQYLISGK